MSLTGKTISPHLMFHNAASNIICQVLLGTRYEYDDHFIRELVRCFTENSKISNGPWAMVSQQFRQVQIPTFLKIKIIHVQHASFNSEVHTALKNSAFAVS